MSAHTMSYPMLHHAKSSLADLRIRWRFLSASAAATQLATATGDIDLFVKGGALQATFDAFNVLCATVYAGLKAFAIANPGLNLGTTYADAFFMHTPRSSQPTTVGAAADLVA